MVNSVVSGVCMFDFFRLKACTLSLGLFFWLGFSSNSVVAQNGPQPWQMNFRPAATPVMEDIVSFHNLLLIIEVLIVLFVLGLMVYIVIKFIA